MFLSKTKNKAQNNKSETKIQSKKATIHLKKVGIKKKHRITQQTVQQRYNLSEYLPLLHSTDIINEILSYLSFRDVVALSHVNKALYQYITTHPLTLNETFTDRNGVQHPLMGIYADLKHFFSMRSLHGDIQRLQTDLNKRKEYTKIPTGPIAVMLSALLFIAIYGGLESFFVYKIYKDNEYHKERNATICADIYHNHTEAAMERFKKNGCYDRPQPFLITAATFGAGAPVLIPFLIGAIACLCCSKQIKIENNISKKEWEAVLKKAQTLFDNLEKFTPPTAIEQNSKTPSQLEKGKIESKAASANENCIKTLNKRRLPITTLKASLRELDARNDEKGQTFASLKLFKNKSNVKSTNDGEIRDHNYRHANAL